MVLYDYLLCMSLGVIPLSGSGSSVASDIFQDWSLFPGMDGFFRSPMGYSIGRDLF